MRLVTDASTIAIGSVLEQLVCENWVPLGFFSRKLNSAQKRYSTFDRELLAVYDSILHFRHLLEGREFFVLTDHKPLTTALASRADRPNERQLRQLDIISQYTNDIRYIPGSDNVVADLLSRDIPNADEVLPTCSESISTFVTALSVSATGLNHNMFSDLFKAQQTDSELVKLRENEALKFVEIDAGPKNTPLWCSISTGKPRLYLSELFRKDCFNRLHDVSHPGQTATRRLICERYIWPNMKKEIRQWVSDCPGCARSKVVRHIHPSSPAFEIPKNRFQHVHMDIVGPYPSSQGKRYIFTFIDRYTRWPEAIPTSSITAEALANCFVTHWVSRYGCPSEITSDRGTQYTSELFAELNRLLGVHHIRTTAYHPEANGMVERFHRTLGDSITAVCASRPGVSWTKVLPMMMLNLRSTHKEGLGASPAELMYGCGLHLPSDLVAPPAKPMPLLDQETMNTAAL